MKLDVYVNTKLVGVLEQIDINCYLFNYVPGTNKEDFVSLTMPVSSKAYLNYTDIHAPFQISIPEGYLRERLTQEYAKFFIQFDDLALLSIVGQNLIGRVKLAIHGEKLNLSKKHQKSINELLQACDKEVLDAYFEQMKSISGVSGAYPKVLDETFDQNLDVSNIALSNWIVKLNTKYLPNLTVNEYFGLSLAKQCGLNVPKFILSDDFSKLLISRFDKDEKGNQLGFEDMCALLGEPSSNKFSGSMERVFKVIRGNIQKKELFNDSRDRLYLTHILNMAIRNSDAHLKNFGLVYDNINNVYLSPAYDILSTGVYAPIDQRNNDALDAPALSFAGVKRWPQRKNLDSFARYCGISKPNQIYLHNKLKTAITIVSEQLYEFAHDNPNYSAIGKRMLKLWSIGMNIHSEDISFHLNSLSESIKPEDNEIYQKRPTMRF